MGESHDGIDDDRWMPRFSAQLMSLRLEMSRDQSLALAQKELAAPMSRTLTPEHAASLAALDRILEASQMA